jgi:hypothetical protein
VPIAGCASQTAAGYQGNEICSGGNSPSSKAVIAGATGAWTSTTASRPSESATLGH